mmetsp:Transcript_130907/g.261157  ORF Transcript_130907/g.261157 Transcript_130907/m.261157 type:complete len:362 (+) Transcript_130907:46-1131(+)
MVCRGVLCWTVWHCLQQGITAGVAFARQTDVEGCFGVMAGEAWRPAMHGATNSTEVSWRLCQARCGLTPACARFTFAQSGACSLHDSTATVFAQALSISGPSMCGSIFNMQHATTADVPPVPQPKLLSFPSIPPEKNAPPTPLPAPSPPQAIGNQVGDVGEQTITSKGLFVSWKTLSALLLLGCLLLGAVAACALWLYARARSEDADDDKDDRERWPGRGSDLHLEEEVIYPSQTQIRWYPNLEHHPSFVEELLPMGLKGSVGNVVSPAARSSTMGAKTQRGSSVQPSARSERSLTLSWHCRVGDFVEVFSKNAGKWVRCQVVGIHGSRMTVAHGSSTRRIDLRDKDLNSYFRLVTHNMIT